MVPGKIGTGFVRRMGCLAALTSVLALSACATAEEEGGGSAAGGGATAASSGGVAYGASKEEYQKAFADIEPIKLNTQTPAPKGSTTGEKIEDYLAAVEEWSGGKITFNVAYANAVAQPTEIDNALADGRLDLALPMPIYEPSEYPANTALNNVSFLGRQLPLVGVLESQAWMLDVAYSTPRIREEFKEKGLEFILPIFNSGHNLLICKEERKSLGDFKGVQIIAGGQVQGKQLGALGATPVSIPYTEVFESLERGVAACTGSTLLGAALGGYIPAANKVAYDADAGFAITTGGVAVNSQVWNDLPLVARQLLFDRLDTFIAASVESTWQSIVEAVDQIRKEGGSFTPLEQDAVTALQDMNKKLLDEARGDTAVGDGGAFVDKAQQVTEEWHKIITEELGFEDKADYEEFADWYKNTKVDLSPYTAKIFEKILLPHRPA